MTDRGPGLRVRLSRIDGLTKKGLLNRPYYFQCPPLEEFVVQWAHEFNDYMTVAQGEYSRRSGRKLRTVQFETLAVDTLPVVGAARPVSPPWVVEQAVSDKNDHRVVLRDVLSAGTPFRLHVAQQLGTDVLLDMPATLRTLNVATKGAEIDTFYFTCEFHEYRDPIVKRNAKSRSGGRKWPHTITLKADGTYRGMNTRDQPLSIRLIAIYLYKDATLAWPLARALGITDYGIDALLIKYPRYKRGGKIVCPAIDKNTPISAPTASTASAFGDDPSLV